MKKTSKIFALVLCLMLCVTLAIPALAAEVEQNGLKLTLTTDKAEYAAEEEIRATLKVENTAAEAAKNLTLKVNAPDGYTGGGSKTVESLAAGSSETLEVSLGVGPAKTGDAISVVIALAVVSGIGALALCNRRAAALMLALVMVAGVGLMAMPASADENKADISTTVKVAGKDVTVTASVTQAAVEEPAPETPDAITLKADGVLTDENGSTMPVALELNLDLVNNTATIYELATVAGEPEMYFYLLASDQNAPDINGWGMAYMMCMEIGAGTVTANADGSYTATFTISGFPVPFTVVNDGDGTYSCSMAPMVTIGMLNEAVTAESVTE